MKEYREPFLGGGSVFFWARANKYSKYFWINDAYRDLVVFYQQMSDPKIVPQVQDALREIYHMVHGKPDVARQWFNVIKTQIATTDDLAIVAHHFYYLNRVTFSGTTEAGGFTEHASQGRFTLSGINLLTHLPEALKDVYISNRDALDLVREPGTRVFLFLDPPYFQSKKLYGKKGVLHDFDHEALAVELAKTKHKFLLTYDDCAEVRELYQWANIRMWSKKYGMTNVGGKSSKSGAELFISNYPLEAA